MRLAEINPIPETRSDYEDIEKEIDRVFKEQIYFPLLLELGVSKKVLQNSEDDLIRAILSSRVAFDQGVFQGRFNAKISKELLALGAKFHRPTSSFRIPLHRLPSRVQVAIRESETRFQKVMEKVSKRLSEIVPERVAENVKLASLFNKEIFKVNTAVNKSMKGIAVPARLSEFEAQAVSDEYTKNLRLYINDFTEKEIVRLREEMQKKVFRGARYEDAVKMIEKSYGVSRRKAKFLARQETSLLMTSFKTERYRQAGIKKYRWRCVAGSAKHPVRPMHKIHDGKIFEYDKPPVTDELGNRNNPGRDYNCRCIDVPIVEFL